MITEKYELPTHWASALNYGEMDGLEDEDIKAIEAFTKDMVKRYGGCWCVEVDSWRSFKREHDATQFGVLATDVSTYTFDISEWWDNLKG